MLDAESSVSVIIGAYALLVIREIATMKGKRKMERVEVQSSNVKAISFHEGTLEVEFKNGGVYRYQDVPGEVFERMKSATSVGRFFNSEIRGQYTSEKIA